jgi:hypothetical protein
MRKEEGESSTYISNASWTLAVMIAVGRVGVVGRRGGHPPQGERERGREGGEGRGGSDRE